MIVLTTLGSYLLGGLCAGYYLVRLAARRDIRAAGSGSAGARNVGRLLGAPGFLGTLLLDAAKGAVAVLAAAHFVAGAWPPALALLAVVAGHIWPLQLGLRGGKGVATAIGGTAAYLALAVSADPPRLAPAAVVAVILPTMVLWAHRDNLAAARARRRGRPR